MHGTATATIDNRTCVLLASPLHMLTVDAVLRAKVPTIANLCQSLCTSSSSSSPSPSSSSSPSTNIPDFTAVFTADVQLPYETLLHVLATMGMLDTSSSSTIIAVNADAGNFPYWCEHNGQRLPLRNYQFYMSVVARVNAAFILLSRVFRVLLAHGRGSTASSLPPEVAAILQIYDTRTTNKSGYKSRQSNKRDRQYVLENQVKVVELAIIVFQLRAYLLAHRPIIDRVRERGVPPLDDNIREVDALRLCYIPATNPYQLDYPTHTAVANYQQWLPASEVITPINSPCVLYWELSQLRLPSGMALSGHQLLAVMPCRRVIEHIHGLVVEHSPIIPAMQQRAATWYSTRCGVEDISVMDIGSVATAIYFIISNLEALYDALLAANTTGSLHREPRSAQNPPLYHVTEADDLPESTHIELLLYAVWLRKMHYLDAVRRFVRYRSLADNTQTRYVIDNVVNLSVSQFTLDVDTSVVATLDPMFAAFLPKTSPVKQLIKGLPQKNLGRALDNAATESVIEEQQLIEDGFDDANSIGNNKKNAVYYQWILPILLCTLTGAYAHAQTRVSFSQCLAIYQYYTEMPVADFAAAITKLRHPIRFALREYLCHITASVPDAVQRHGINYSTFQRSTINICNYMRAIADKLTKPIAYLPSFISDAVVSVISSKMVDSEVKSVCGVIYRQLRRVVHPLVSYPKTDFATFLFKALYTIAQEAIVQYMLLHEQLETMYHLIERCQLLIGKLHTDGLPPTDDNITKLVDGQPEFATMRFDIADMRTKHHVDVQFPTCLLHMEQLTDICTALQHRLVNGTVIYVLDGPEMADLLKLLCSESEELVIDHIAGLLSPTATDALVNVFRKYAYGANEKSVKQLIASAFTPRELSAYFYILYCRRFLCHRVVDAPLSHEASTNLAMSVMRIGSMAATPPDSAFTIYFLPCCNRISTFAKEDTSGNKDVVYNPSSALFECGAAQNPGYEIIIPPLLRAATYKGVIPYFGIISAQKRNNQRKYARAILHHNNKIPCDGTPAIPICLKNRQFLFYDNDGGVIVYYFCPTCARLTKEHILSTRTTLTMCSICKHSSVIIRRWQECYFCKQSATAPIQVFIATNSNRRSASSSSSSSSSHAFNSANRVFTTWVCSPCYSKHGACSFPLSHPKSLPVISVNTL